jgi:D-xylose transport system permease protein
MVDKTQQGTPAQGPFQRWLKGLMDAADFGMLPVIAALVVIWIIFEFLNPNFLTPRNLSNLAAQIVVTGTLALAEIYVILLGMIDLSIGWNSVIAASVFSLGTAFYGWPIWLCIVVALGATTLLGGAQGLLVSRVGVPSFIVSLGGAMIAEGAVLAMLTDHGGSVPLSDDFTNAIGTLYVSPLWTWIVSLVAFAIYAALSFRRNATAIIRMVGLLILVVAGVAMLNGYRGMPWLLVIFLVALFASGFITKATQFGRHLYAVGGNVEAARRAGINVRGVQLAAFVISGFLVGIAGLLDGARLGVASASVGDGDIMLNAVAAAVIGGTSLFGGRGSVFGAFFGALVIESVANGMDLLGAPSSTRFGVEGAILLSAITIDTLLRKKRLQTGRA